MSAVIPHSRLLVDSRHLQVRPLRRNLTMESAPYGGYRVIEPQPPTKPRSTILHQPKKFCRSISRRPPFRSSPDPPTRPTSWWTFKVGRRGLGDELRDLPQFGHARQVPSVRRSPPLPPRLARRDPPLSAASLRCSQTVLSRHLPRASDAWRPSCADLKCVPMLLLADARVNAARQPHRQPRRRLK